MKYAARAGRLGKERSFLVMDRARELESRGADVIHLEIGEPDFDTPLNIKDAAKRALDDNWTHYVPSAGIDDLRDAAAHYFRETRGLDAKRENVMIAPGAKPIMFYAALALLEEGDEAVYPVPGFAIYRSAISYSGAKPVPLRLREELDWRFDPEDLKKAVGERTRMICLNSPHNPTGGMLGREELEAVADIVRGTDIVALTDEVYIRLVYGDDFLSVASLEGMADNVIVMDGFSKTYAMTGWRVGFSYAPAEITDRFVEILSNSEGCTCAFAQKACVEALTGPQEESFAMVREFNKRRDLVVERLNAMPGVTCTTPRGSFFVFPNISGTGRDGAFLEDYLLREAHVACLAGHSFGPGLDDYVRLSYAESPERLSEAFDRMERALARL